MNIEGATGAGRTRSDQGLRALLRRIMKSLLVVTKAPDVLKTIENCFSGESEIVRASNNDEALKILQGKRYDFVFIDLELLGDSASGMRYKDTLSSFWQLYPSIEVIVMCPPQGVRDAVMAVKAGASNYVTYPIDPEELKYVVESVYQFKLMESELEYLRDRFWQAESIEIVNTNSPLMRTVFEKVKAVAPTKTTVMLMGETGTGKGVVARLIHGHSSRKDESFVSVHCGAIPDTLLESELFGHEKGAFTGAVRRKLGKFEIARGGTIFLDEVATLTPSAQIKLLQILQDGLFERVGGEDTLEADVRIIAAANVDLSQMSDQRLFRKDLYYRLNVFPIEIPPLRERREDIPIILDNVLKKLNKVHARQIHSVEADVLRAFSQYSWPGNIREMENLVERAYILENSPMLTKKVLPQELFPKDNALSRLPIDTSLTLEQVRNQAIAQVETSYLKRLLTEKMGRIGQTAEAAGIGTRQLHKLMIKYGLRKEIFRSLGASEHDPEA